MKYEVEDYQKTDFIYTKIHYFDNTFNPIENIYSFCIRNKNTKTHSNWNQTNYPPHKNKENLITTFEYCNR